MYKFSVPMLYEKEYIDKIENINKQIEKSRITSLYFGLPYTCEFFTGFEQVRNFYKGNRKFEEWKSLIYYTLEKGFDFIYLLNSPKGIQADNPDFPKMVEKLDVLLNELKGTGCKLRVSNPQLISYISFHYPEFPIYASTSFEYKTLKEYQNFILMHPNVKQIVPSHDVNKNFKLLKNIKKSLPNVEIELMANEGCMGGCPHRNFHAQASVLHKDTKIERTLVPYFYYVSECEKILNRNYISNIFSAYNVYPWEIQEYSKIEINNFKLAGRNNPDTKQTINSFIVFLKGIDDIKYIENEKFTILVHRLHNIDFPVTVKEIKPYLPNIKHFIKNGHLCASICGIDCRYCYDCALKMGKYLNTRN